LVALDAWGEPTQSKVISSDRVKGYGFVAPQTGSEYVFVHVNDLYSDNDLLKGGSTVEFELEEGDRGPRRRRSR